MRALLPLAVGLGLADSLNPITIAVAIYLATHARPLATLAGYAIGVFVTYFLGGLLLLFGPAVLLRTATEGIDPTLNAVIALVVGVGCFAFSAVIWSQRHRMAGAELPERARHPGSTLALGAGMTAIDLPTAFPLFAMVAAVAKADPPAHESVGVMVVFTLCYVSPLVAILVVRALAGERAEPLLLPLRERVAAWAPAILCLITIVAGVWLCFTGVRDLVAA